jgi:hypothetical protein
VGGALGIVISGENAYVYGSLMEGKVVPGRCIYMYNSSQTLEEDFVMLFHSETWLYIYDYDKQSGRTD